MSNGGITILIIKKKIKIMLFICISILLITWSLLHHPIRHGDGWEYISMSVSMGNHFSPNLTESDILELRGMHTNNELSIPPLAGYYKDLNGKEYSLHFWFYSLLSVIPYWILKIFGFTTFAFLQFTNVLIMLFGVWYTLFKFSGSERVRNWALVFLVFNPIWLYLPWTHPELFTFVFLFVGLLAYIEKKPFLAILLTALASFQNPAVAIITAYIGLNELIKERKINRRIISLGSLSLIVLFPYLWSWIHYHKFSIIADRSTGPMNLLKSFSLLIDLNFGAVLYIPIVFFTIIYLILKFNRQAILWSIIVFVICLTCSVQNNWNSDMSYINRYTVWMLPLFMVAVMQIITTMKKKYFLTYSLLFALTTGLITMYAIFNPMGYVEFSPLAKLAIKKAPMFYYPQYEVFIERTTGREYGSLYLPNTLPLEYANENGLRKKLYIENGKYRYSNGPIDFSHSEYYGRLLSFKSTEDIFVADAKAAFISGWYDLEGKSRWISQEAKLLLYSNVVGQKKISVDIVNFQKPRDCKIFINDKLVYVGKIDKPSTISFEASIKSYNKVLIQSSDPATSPSDINVANTDTRKLSFSVGKFYVSEKVAI